MVQVKRSFVSLLLGAVVGITVAQNYNPPDIKTLASKLYKITSEEVETATKK